MVVSVDAEKVFGKFLHSFMIKALIIPEIEGNFLKNICTTTLEANTIFNSEKLDALHLR